MHAGKGFQPNLQDPRFKSLFTSADYALDPTDPRFQQIDGSKGVAKEVATQRQHHAAQRPAGARPVQAVGSNGLEVNTQSGNDQDGMPVANESAQLKSMIASLKRKSSRAASKVPSGVPKASDGTIKKVKKKQRTG